MQQFQLEFDISNKDKPVSYEQCQSIYRNTLGIMNTNKTTTLDAQSYTRELFQTQRCDKYKDLSELRLQFVQELGSECTARIVEPNLDATGIDLFENFYVVNRTSSHQYRCQQVKFAMTPLG